MREVKLIQLGIRIPSDIVALMKSDSKRLKRSMQSIGIIALQCLYRYDFPTRSAEIVRAPQQKAGRKTK